MRDRSPFSRRTFLRGTLGLAATALLAACGGDDDDDEESEPTATSSTGSDAEATSVDSPESTATSDDGAEPTAMSSEDGATSEETSSDVEIPERIVALGYADELLALDITPVGAGLTYADIWYPHLEEQMANVESVGKWFEPNLEAILALEPDLIISYASLEADLGEQLAAIAPVEYVVFSEKGGAEGVRENLFAVAEVLGLQERADARYQEHLQKIETAKQQLDEAVGDETVAFIRVLAKEYRLVTTEVGYIGPVLYDDLGLTPPAYITDVADPGDTEGNGYVNMSLEIIPEIQADHIFFLSEDEDTLTELTESSLWQTMPAFESGNIYQVNAVSWQTTAILANEFKIDEVLEALVGASAAASSGFTYPEYVIPQPMLEIVSETESHRLVRDVFGEVEVPKDPQRIVTLDPVQTDMVLALGFIPVAAGANVDGSYHRYLAERLAGVEPIPNEYEPSLEAVLSHEPDLIVADLSWGPELYEQLSKIAPTISVNGNAWANWRRATQDLATVLGVPERAEELIAGYEQLIEEARASLPEGLQDGSERLGVILVQEKEMRLYGIGTPTDEGLVPASVTQVPYFDLRLTPPDIVTDVDTYAMISTEILPDLEAEHLLLIEWSGGGTRTGTSDTIAEILDSQLWQTMPAVQSGNVYQVANDWATPGPVNIRHQLEEFIAAVTGQGAE